MAKTQAERAKEYRERKRDARSVTKRDDTVTDRHKSVTEEAECDGTVSPKTLAIVDAACGDKLSHGLALPPVPALPTGEEPGPTGSTCHSFETLPVDVRRSIDSLTAWCKLKGIEDDRQARIARAIHYQRNVRRAG